MTGLPVVRYSRECLPLTDGPGALAVEDWPRWHPPGGGDPIPAVRIVGPFELDDLDSIVSCADGWLAVNALGEPYPIPVDEFRRYGRWQPDAEEATA